ncbi:MAG TPA: hypothetical protein VF147_05440 [Vicinamibacterales bacterium]
MQYRTGQGDKLLERILSRFEQVDKRFDVLEAHIADEHEKTRRYFTVAFEQMKAERNLVLDQSSGNAERLDDHERRIRALERRK